MTTDKVEGLKKATQTRRLEALDTIPDQPFDVEFHVEAITPDVAKMLLEGNVDNRNLRPRTVQRYARDMAGGSWQLTHEAIGIDAEGNLVDGQHRLRAVIEADTPVWMTVAYYVPMEARRVIDDGARRNAADTANFANAIGFRVTHKHTSVARRLLLSYELGLGGNPSRSEIAGFIKRHEQAILFSDAAFPSHERGLTVAPVRAAVAVASYTERECELREFARALVRGGRDARGEVAMLLWRRLTAAARKGTHRKRTADDPHSTMLAAQRAIHAWCRYEALGNLIVPDAPIYDLPKAETENDAADDAADAAPSLAAVV